MRYQLILLSLATLVTGQTTPKPNCTARSDAMKVKVAYNEYFGVGLEWDPPAVGEGCVHRYSVCVTLNPSGSPSCANTSDTSWSTRSVQPCSNYSVAVQALDEGGKHLAAGSVAFFTPPSEVTNYTLSKRTSSSLLMTWVVPAKNTCVKKYVVSWRKTTEEKDEGSHNLSTTATSDEVNNLDPCTMYSVSITGFTADNVQTSQGLSLYTAAKGSPLPVSGVNAMFASSSSLHVGWNETSSCIKSYKVCINAVGDKNKTCSVANDGEAQLTSGDVIKPCTNYSIAVTAVDYAGQESSETVQTFTGAPGEVEKLGVSSRTANSNTVTWSPPAASGASCLHSYELYVCAHGGDPADCADPVDAPALTDKSYLVGSLDVCGDYDIVIKSVATNGQRSYGASLNSYTDVADVNTAVANYGTGMDYNLTLGDELMLEASWDLPDDRSCLSGYRVCYTDNSAKSSPNCSDQGVTNVDWSLQEAQYCSNYTITVSAITITGQYYPQLTGFVLTPPYVVQNLTAKEVTGTSIHVAWAPPPDSSSTCLQQYTVHWCPEGEVGCNTDSDKVASKTLGTDAKDYTLTGLRNCTTYLIWVKTLGTDGAESEANFMYAKAGGGVPGKVESLWAPRKTCGSVYTEWAEPKTNTECVSNYELCWQGTSTNKQTCYNVSNLDTEYYITGLEPSTAYNVTVAAMGAGGERSEPSIVLASTQAVKEIKELTFNDSTETSISVSWNSPEENSYCAQAISVAWCYKDEERCEPTTNNSVRIPTNITEYNITGLLPCSNYTISVSVATAGNAMSARRTIRLPTLHQSPISVGKLSQMIMDSTVMISWEAPSLAETCKAGYQVCWEQHKESASPVCSHTNIASYMFYGLPSCKTYLAYVSTITTSGSLSAPANIDLDLATPSKVGNLTVSKNTSDTVVVSWLRPVLYSECVVNYTLCHIEATGGNETCETISKEETTHSITGLQPKTQYNITLIAVGPESKQSAARRMQVVTDASGGSGNAGSRLGSTYTFNSLLSYGVVILLIHRLLFSY